MICTININKYCKEDPSKIENYDKAIADETQTWACHHRDEVKVLPSGMIVIRSKEELIENGRYYNCPANELIFLTIPEHNKLHRNVMDYKCSKCTEETRKKMSNSHLGLNYNLGNTYSEFGYKFKEHYGITRSDNIKLYKNEHQYYVRHGKCRWE